RLLARSATETYPPLDQAWHLDEGRNSSWSPFTRQDLTHSTVTVRRDLRRLRDWRTPLSIVHSSFHFPLPSFWSKPCRRARNPSRFPSGSLASRPLTEPSRRLLEKPLPINEGTQSKAKNHKNKPFGCIHKSSER